MSCKDCRYFEGGFCSNQDTIVDPDDRACIGYEPRKERRMKLFIETPALIVRTKLEDKKAVIEEEQKGLILKEVVNINPSPVGIRVIFKSSNNIPEEIELGTFDYRLLHLYTD
jgi:hypothetical protein